MAIFVRKGYILGNIFERNTFYFMTYDKLSIS